MITCDQCGAKFHRAPSQVGKRNFCNRACYNAWQREHPPDSLKLGRKPRGHSSKHFCSYCKKPILRSPRDKRYTNHFCDRSCKDAWHGEHCVGPANSNWKGGRLRMSEGYILVYQPGHPRAMGKYVAEHILIAEEKYGHPIPRTKHVHHLNGIKDDNRPENLVVIDPKDHDTYSVRHALQERVIELEAEIQCLRHSDS